MTKITKTLIITLAFIAGSVFVFAEEEVKQNNLIKEARAVTSQVICTADAKKCSDGSYVGRVAPDCSFAKCPDDGDRILIEPVDPKKVYLPKEEKDKVLCTMEFDPVCALVDTGIRCISEPCPSKVEKTFGNECQAKAAGAEIIREGVCNETEVKYLGPPIEIDPEPISVEGKGVVSVGVVVPGSTFDELVKAKNEEERRVILESQKVSKDKLNDKEVLSVEATTDEKTGEEKESEERKKNNIEKKSLEIFPKFDYFTTKLESILNKVEDRVENLDNFELVDTLKSTRTSLEKAQEQKVQAWILFNSLVEVETKEDAKKILSEVKTLLDEAKVNIKLSFDSLKEIINYLKK